MRPNIGLTTAIVGWQIDKLIYTRFTSSVVWVFGWHKPHPKPKTQTLFTESQLFEFVENMVVFEATKHR